MSSERTVLIVEDQPMVLEIAIEEFADAGYRVLTAERGDEAVALLESDAPIDALFTDIRIPGGVDGWRLAEVARKLRPKIAVIYATGFTAEEPRMVEGSQFFRKPYRMAQVIDATAALIPGSPS